MGVQLVERGHAATRVVAAPITRQRVSATTLAAAAAVALVPVWWHLTLVDPHIDNVTAVFSTVAIYPSDVCLLIIAATGLRSSSGWSTALMLPAAAVLSVAVALDRTLAASVSVHLVLLAGAWLAIRQDGASARWIVRGLVIAAGLEASLAVAQFVSQQPLVPGWLELPWLPGPDVSVGGTPVVLSADGQRLFRAFGTFPHPNVLGGYLALALVALFSLDRRWWYVAPVLAAGLLVTFSRAGWVAAALGLSIWLVSADTPRWRKGALVFLGGVILLALLASPLGPTVAGRVWPWSGNALERGSIGNRLQLDLDAVTEIRTHLPFGVGAGNAGLASVRDGLQVSWGEPPPNVPLLIATELGGPGVLAAGAMAMGLTAAVWRTGSARVPIVAVCSVLVVLGMLDHYLWTMPPGRVMAWVPLALAAEHLRARPARPGRRLR